MSFKVHTPKDAPEEAREILAGAEKSYGFVPNLMATMAGAPALLKAYAMLTELFDKTSLNATERQVVLLTVSRENECRYCMAAHSVIASMQKVPDDVIASLRNDEAIADAKLEALRQFTRSVVATRGYPEEAVTKRFLEAGYGNQQVLEVILGVGMKTLSNYTNHIAGVQNDAAFEQAAWPDKD